MKFGLIGHPISLSLSPRIFASAYGGKYQYDLIQGADFTQSWQRFLEGYDGINVTAPFKEKAYEAADILSPEVERIKASNLLVKTVTGGRTLVKAFNSDYMGVRRCLEEQRVGRGDDVLVIGFGGAGKAALAAAEDIGAHITVANRTVSKIRGAVPLSEISSGHRHCVIYALSMPVEGLERLDADIIIEANYKHPSFTTEILERLKGRNPALVYVPGTRWHFWQAAEGYALFTGEKPDCEKMLETYRNIF